jgi:hypothetical protein
VSTRVPVRLFSRKKTPLHFLHLYSFSYLKLEGYDRDARRQEAATSKGDFVSKDASGGRKGGTYLDVDGEEEMGAKNGESVESQRDGTGGNKKGDTCWITLVWARALSSRGVVARTDRDRERGTW